MQVWHCVSIKVATVAECTLPSHECVLFRVFSTLSGKIFFALDFIDSQGVRSKCAPFARPLRVTLSGGQSWRWHEHGGELRASRRNSIAATSLSLGIVASATALATQRCWKQSELCEARHLPGLFGLFSELVSACPVGGDPFFFSLSRSCGRCFVPFVPASCRVLLFSVSVRVVSDTSLSVLCGREC